MKNKLYSLLIGITDYPSPNLLFECVNDANKMKDYLTNLETDAFDVQNPILLTNKLATKQGVARAIRKIISKLKDGDTFLFYFSGHGTREISKGRFREDHNGLLETIVCYYEKERKNNNFLLADKELRYLFHKCPKKAHIISIFDCCHSGDIMRDFEEETKHIRRIGQKQAPRLYKHFLFHEIPAKTFDEKWFSEIFPDANILTISACQSDESSWEKDNGGVFTTNMLQVLKDNNSVPVSYTHLTLPTICSV